MSGRPQVTITLGHTGQVVKRDFDDQEVCRHSDRHGEFPAETKRKSVRDRLGSDNFARNKRQQIDTDKWTSVSDIYNGRQNKVNFQIGQDDLRLKLMQKNLSRQMKEREKNGGNLCNGYSTPLQRHSQYDAQDVPVSKSPNHLRRIPPKRSAEGLLHMESLRKSYSSWDIDGGRHRSPDRYVGASKGFDGVSSFRSAEPLLPPAYISKNVVDTPRPVTHIPKGPIHAQGPNPIMNLPPPGTCVPKSTFTLEEHLTVGGFLNSLGLAKYAILFQAEEIDMAALRQLGDGDLKDLGIPMGPRKKILLAVARPRQRPA